MIYNGYPGARGSIFALLGDSAITFVITKRHFLGSASAVHPILIAAGVTYFARKCSEFPVCSFSEMLLR